MMRNLNHTMSRAGIIRSTGVALVAGIAVGCFGYAASNKAVAAPEPECVTIRVQGEPMPVLSCLKVKAPR